MGPTISRSAPTLAAARPQERRVLWCLVSAPRALPFRVSSTRCSRTTPLADTAETPGSTAVKTEAKRSRDPRSRFAFRSPRARWIVAAPASRRVPGLAGGIWRTPALASAAGPAAAGPAAAGPASPARASSSSAHVVLLLWLIDRYPPISSVPRWPECCARAHEHRMNGGKPSRPATWSQRSVLSDCRATRPAALEYAVRLTPPTARGTRSRQRRGRFRPESSAWLLRSNRPRPCGSAQSRDPTRPCQQSRIF